MEQYKMLINCQSKGNLQERQKLTHIEYGDTKQKLHQENSQYDNTTNTVIDNK